MSRRLQLVVIAAAAASIFSTIPAAPAVGQERGAAALANALDLLRHDVPRVLYIAAHPDDEDQRLMAWLSRGGHAEMAYLSLSRGEGGQNVIGDELGDALGVLRTEELLSARRIDGAEQFFTRAYDFGYSKDADETFLHWPRDSLLDDVVRVVRAFRPHVIATTFSGTARDGHGQHQVSALVARDVYEIADDTVRFPVDRFGPAWRPLKLYRRGIFSPGEPTVVIDVGGFDPLSGRSYGEIAGEARAQHRSQAFGRNDTPGRLLTSYRREATRVNEETPAGEERSILDGIVPFAPGSRAARDVNYVRPETALPFIARFVPRDERERVRFDRAAILASGVLLQALSARDFVAEGDTVTVSYSLYNRGAAAVRLDSAAAGFPTGWIPPDSAVTWSAVLRAARVSQPWWLTRARQGALYGVPVPGIAEAALEQRDWARTVVSVAGLPLPVRLSAPIEFRSSTPFAIHYTPLAVTPGFTATPARDLWFARASQRFERALNVTVRSAYPGIRQAIVRPRLPAGMTAEPVEHRVSLEGGQARTVTFRLTGQLTAGRHAIPIDVMSGGQTFTHAVRRIAYEHITPRLLFQAAVVQATVVEVNIPPGVAVGYIRGMADDGPDVLRDLGVPVTMIAPEELPAADLARFTTIVVGPRAYEAHAALLEHNQRLFDYATNGGRLVVQYGQDLMGAPGVLAVPATIGRPPMRVTDENAPVTFTDPAAPELNYPNRIAQADFAGWVQERVTFAPRDFDSRYRTFIATNDPGEEPIHSAVLVAPLGRGTYVYTTLALFRQFTAGVPGAARLFVNLLTPPR